MDRRNFLKKTMAVGSVFMGPGLLANGCTRNLRGELVDSAPRPTVESKLNSSGWNILHYASLAPSGHNSQPWFVRVEDRFRWVIGSDKTRWLKVVDPDNREVLLSLGAFIENLVQAAAAAGYVAEVQILARDCFDPDVARVTLKQNGGQRGFSLERMVSRRTVKNGMLSREIQSQDLQAFQRAAGGGFYYFPRGSQHSDMMAEQAIENFKRQFENQAAMQEAALWTRLSDDEARKFRDGLTTDGMEINGMAGWYVRNFMDVRDVTGKTWRKKGIEKTMAQAREGGGWLVITSAGNGVKDLIAAGRSFQRMALTAREKNIGIHPMTQSLEEVQGQKVIRENHSPGMIPQFMLRVGYVDKYPDPVSLRRPVGWFLV